ncbi:hypothetical protein AB0G54_41425 [Streptomyces yokosukanensis]|uniref:hypothetical protein n=1 Tax=Streptomyces yokosukanensis TaxID=67386 RepID=UPI003422D0E6
MDGEINRAGLPPLQSTRWSLSTSVISTLQAVAGLIASWSAGISTSVLGSADVDRPGQEVTQEFCSVGFHLNATADGVVDPSQASGGFAERIDVAHGVVGEEGRCQWGR